MMWTELLVVLVETFRRYRLIDFMLIGVKGLRYVAVADWTPKTKGPRTEYWLWYLSAIEFVQNYRVCNIFQPKFLPF